MLASLILAAALSGEPPQAPRVQILDVGAVWCGACVEADKDLRTEKRLTYGDKVTCDIRKVDYDAYQDWAERMRVKSLPTFILLVDGRERKRFEGFPGRQKLFEEVQSARKGLK